MQRGPHTGLAAMTQPGLHPDTTLDDVFSDDGLKTKDEKKNVRVSQKGLIPIVFLNPGF